MRRGFVHISGEIVKSISGLGQGPELGRLIKELDQLFAQNPQLQKNPEQAIRTLLNDRI